MLVDAAVHPGAKQAQGPEGRQVTALEPGLEVEVDELVQTLGVQLGREGLDGAPD